MKHTYEIWNVILWNINLKCQYEMLLYNIILKSQIWNVHLIINLRCFVWLTSKKSDKIIALKITLIIERKSKVCFKKIVICLSNLFWFFLQRISLPASDIGASSFELCLEKSRKLFKLQTIIKFFVLQRKWKKIFFSFILLQAPAGNMQT